MRNDSVRELISRTIEGVEALVSTESGEIFIDVPAADPRYIRVNEGDTIREGDIRSRTEDELESPSLGKWTIEKIGPEMVIGTDRETGERTEWDRKSLEQSLAIGGHSTILTDFDRVNVVEESGAGTLDESRSGGETVRKSDRETASDSDEKSVTVAAYGTDGRKFIRTYRPVDDAGGDRRRLELAEEDESVERLERDLRERLDEAVERSLRNEGYEV